MTDFQIDDEVRLKKTHNIQSIEHVTNSIALNWPAGWLDADLYELVPPKPVYQNTPSKHCNIICHVANGGLARSIKGNFLINCVWDTNWGNDEEYEIVQPKTEDELRIEELEKTIETLMAMVKGNQKELAELKPTVNY